MRSSDGLRRGWCRSPVSATDDLPELRAIVGRLHPADRSGAGTHHQRLGRRVPVVAVADAIEQVAVGDAGRGEEDVVPPDQVVGVEYPVEVVAGVDRRPSLLVVTRPEPTEDPAAHAFDRRRGEDPLRSPTDTP